MSQTALLRRAIWGWGTLAVAIAGVAGVAAWSGALSNAERLLSNSYGVALADADGAPRPLAVTPALTNGGDAGPVNAIWAGRPGVPNRSLRHPLAVGDRITITSSDGKPNRLAVIELEQIDGAVIGAPGVRFQMVTTREEAGANGGVVRFLVAIDTGEPQRSDKTL